MAQESWKNETDEIECQRPKSPILCVNNCGFFGSSVTNNMCSKCYRDIVMNQQNTAAPLVPVAEKMPTVASSSSVAFEPPRIKLCKLDGSNVVDVAKNHPEEVCNKQTANRCFVCRKRLGLTGFKCRCEGTFCSTHRYSETHECSFDYKSAGRQTIAKENPVIKAEKIEKI